MVRIAVVVGEDLRRTSESRGERRRCWSRRKASRKESDNHPMATGWLRESSLPTGEICFALFTLASSTTSTS